MNKNELKNNLTKQINNGMNALFDVFGDAFEDIVSNFDKFFSNEKTSEKKEVNNEPSVDTTEIHAYKEWKDGKCVNSEKKIWKNGNLVHDEGTASCLDSGCDSKCHCKKTENKKVEQSSVNDTCENSKAAENNKLKQQVAYYKAQSETYYNEILRLKEQIDKAKKIFQ